LQPDNARAGIESLKTSLMLYLGGGILVLLPVVGTLAVLLDFVALILLISSWRALGRSTLSQAPDYRSTGSWLLRAIVIVLGVSFVGTIVLALSLVASAISSGAQAFPNGTELSRFLFDFGVLFSGVYVIWLAAWIKMCFSMKKLAKEISVPRFDTAGNLLVLQAILGFGSSAATFFLIVPKLALATGGQSTNPFASLSVGELGYFLLGGYFSILALVVLAGTITLIVASYLGYGSLNSFLKGYAGPTPRPSTPTWQSTVPSQRAPPVPMNYCPRCGRKLERPAAYCAGCGANLLE